MGQAFYGDGFRADWYPLGPTDAREHAPYTHEVTLWHDGEPVAWDVCHASDCEATANRLHVIAL